MEYKDIELRSEKMRKIVGEIPPALTCCGITVIAIIMTLLIAAVTLVHYPRKTDPTLIERIFHGK